MSRVPKLSLSKLQTSDTPWPSSPVKRVSRKTSLCETPQRSQSLETSALHFQPRALKSLAHERVLFKTLRQIQTDRQNREAKSIQEGWKLKVSTVTSEWQHFRALSGRRNPFSIVKHFTVSPRPLSSERVNLDNSQRLLNLAEAANSVLRLSVQQRTSKPIPEAPKEDEKPQPAKQADYSRRCCCKSRPDAPKLRSKKDAKPRAPEPPKASSKLPKSTHTKSCSHLVREHLASAQKQSGGLLSRLTTPVLAGRK